MRAARRPLLFGYTVSRMKRAAAALLVLGSLWSAQERKGKSPRPPELAVLELKVQREPGHVIVDGRVRNNTGKSLKGLNLFFHFLAPGGATISRQQTRVAENPMEPGEEGSFHAQSVDPVRAVHIRLEAEDQDGRYLRVDKPGPYTIE